MFKKKQTSHDVFFFIDDETNFSTEAGRMVLVKLCDLPRILQHNGGTYELKAAINYRQCSNKLRSSVGHYNAYCKRNDKRWEIMDDLKPKPISVSELTSINCEYLLYTI